MPRTVIFACRLVWMQLTKWTLQNWYFWSPLFRQRREPSPVSHLFLSSLSSPYPCFCSFIILLHVRVFTCSVCMPFHMFVEASQIFEYFLIGLIIVCVQLSALSISLGRVICLLMHIMALWIARSVKNKYRHGRRRSWPNFRWYPGIFFFCDILLNINSYYQSWGLWFWRHMWELNKLILENDEFFTSISDLRRPEFIINIPDLNLLFIAIN
jgi:hypothetical protein